VSSAHPDETLHGAGFVARMSGSTAEFISIWNTMMVGKQPFSIMDGQLYLSLQPAIPGWLFTQDGEVSFRFLGQCTVTYHNPACSNTHDLIIKRFVFSRPQEDLVEIHAQVLPSPYAEMIRNGLIDKLDVWF
jgi:hypothetical protein